MCHMFCLKASPVLSRSLAVSLLWFSYSWFCPAVGSGVLSGLVLFFICSGTVVFCNSVILIQLNIFIRIEMSLLLAGIGSVVLWMVLERE